jgi:hypothetical protein
MVTKKRELTDAQWNKVQRLLPKEMPSPRGGRRRIDDREVLEGKDQTRKGYEAYGGGRRPGCASRSRTCLGVAA